MAPALQVHRPGLQAAAVRAGHDGSGTVQRGAVTVLRDAGNV